MGEMYPPTAADYAWSAAQDAQRAVGASNRKREAEIARIEKLEVRVAALENLLRDALGATRSD